MDMPHVLFIKFTTTDNTFPHSASTHLLTSTAKIITWLVFTHWSRMLSMIWLKTNINRYLLHWFPTAGWFLFLRFYDNLFLTGLTFIIINSHAYTSGLTWVYSI